MHVTNCPGWVRHRWRHSLAATPFVSTILLSFAVFAGQAQAVEFDANIRAPMMKNAAELRTQAQDFSTRYGALGDAALEHLIKDAALARDQFELRWKVQRAIDEHRPIDELASLGIVSDVNGIVRVDFNAFPQWLRYDERLASLLPGTDPEALGKELVRRGFREADVAALGNYLATHDLARSTAQGALPVALSFSKIVRKFDKLKRPVDDALLLSYVYQQARLKSEVSREWAAGLIQALDAQRGRILIEYVSEFRTTGLWTPTEQSAAQAEILATMRRPDFEQQATAEATGVRP